MHRVVRGSLFVACIGAINLGSSIGIPARRDVVTDWNNAALDAILASSADVLRFNGGYGAQVYAGSGYVVLKPNYRGSTNYGEAFKTDIVNNYFQKGYEDIMTGVDYLIARGIVEAHGGRIWVEPGSSQGAMLRVSLPRRSPSESGASDRATDDAKD